jgi:hypothetical protein
VISRERLIAYLLGDLQERDAEAVARAEREDASVRAELERLRMVLATLEGLGSPLEATPADPDLAAATMDRIRAVAAEPTLMGRALVVASPAKSAEDDTLVARALPPGAPPAPPRWLAPVVIVGLAAGAITLATLSVQLPLPTTAPVAAETEGHPAPPVAAPARALAVPEPDPREDDAILGEPLLWPVPAFRDDLGPADPIAATDRALAGYETPLLRAFVRDGAFPLSLRDVLPPDIVPLDGWGRPLRYLTTADRRRAWVVSTGPDGVLDTTDDRSLDILERRIEPGPAPEAALRPGRLAVPEPD